MEITVYDKDVHSLEFEETIELLQFVLEGLDSLEQIEASYRLVNETTVDKLPVYLQEVVKSNGESILPVTVLDGEIVKMRDYPSLNDIKEYTGIHFSIERDDECGHNCQGDCHCGHHH